MASERAKALAAEQKAIKQAEKERRKTSTNPADWGRFRQMREVYRVTAEHDKRAPLMMLGAFVGSILLLSLVGIWLKPWWTWPILGVLVGFTAALAILTWRAKTAALKRYEGQAGSAEVALGMLPKEWKSTPAITATRHLDVIHRAVGPGGIVLVGEGDPGRVRALLATETKKHETVKYGTHVTSIVMGDRPNQVPLTKLTDHIKKLPKILSTAEIAELSSRLKALDAVRPRLPMPKGPMPTSGKGARQALRGR